MQNMFRPAVLSRVTEGEDGRVRVVIGKKADLGIAMGGGTDLASDLTVLARLFKDGWGRVSSKTAVEKPEIDRAAERKRQFDRDPTRHTFAEG
jgi:hypothetical protein